jgi:hypothetical protein
MEATAPKAAGLFAESDAHGLRKNAAAAVLDPVNTA